MLGKDLSVMVHQAVDKIGFEGPYIRKSGALLRRLGLSGARRSPEMLGANVPGLKNDLIDGLVIMIDSVL